MTKQNVEIVNGYEVETSFCRNGFGIEFRSYTERPYAVYVNGQILRTASGAKRTFGDKAAALKAGRKYASQLPAKATEAVSVHPCA